MEENIDSISDDEDSYVEPPLDKPLTPTDGHDAGANASQRSAKFPNNVARLKPHMRTEK